MVIGIDHGTWRKSSHSGDNGGGCVEICTTTPGVVLIRDSKDKTGPRLAVSGQAWSELVHAIKHGQFDL
jgi:hypothetical protein